MSILVQISLSVSFVKWDNNSRRLQLQWFHVYNVAQREPNSTVRCPENNLRRSWVAIPEYMCFSLTRFFRWNRLTYWRIQTAFFCQCVWLCVVSSGVCFSLAAAGTTAINGAAPAVLSPTMTTFPVPQPNGQAAAEVYANGVQYPAMSAESPIPILTCKLFRRTCWPLSLVCSRPRQPLTSPSYRDKELTPFTSGIETAVNFSIFGKVLTSSGRNWSSSAVTQRSQLEGCQSFVQQRLWT